MVGDTSILVHLGFWTKIRSPFEYLQCYWTQAKLTDSFSVGQWCLPIITHWRLLLGFFSFLFFFSFPLVFTHMRLPTQNVPKESNYCRLGKTWLKNYRLPAKGHFACCEFQGFYCIIGWRLTVWALCWHNSQRRREMLVNLLKAKTRTTISTKCLLFKWINRIKLCRIDGFSWNLTRTLTEEWGTKLCEEFLLNQILPSWRPRIATRFQFCLCSNLTDL